MYTTAAHIISHVTGIPFQTYITRNIISPLGMNSTTYSIAEAEKLGKVADGFVDTNVENMNPNRRFKPIPFWSKKGGEDLIAGPGGVISNAKDMVRNLSHVLPNSRPIGLFP